MFLQNGYARNRCLVFIATIKRTAYNFNKYCSIVLHILRQFINYLPLEFAFHWDYFVSVTVKTGFFFFSVKYWVSFGQINAPTPFSHRFSEFPETGGAVG